MLKVSAGLTMLAILCIAAFGMTGETKAYGAPVGAAEANNVHGACYGYIGVVTNGCGFPCIVGGSGVTLKAWITGGPFSVSSAYFDCGCGYFGSCAVYGCGGG